MFFYLSLKSSKSFAFCCLFSPDLAKVEKFSLTSSASENSLEIAGQIPLPVLLRDFDDQESNMWTHLFPLH